jgi:hypothetical protein
LLNIDLGTSTPLESDDVRRLCSILPTKSSQMNY